MLWCALVQLWVTSELPPWFQSALSILLQEKHAHMCLFLSRVQTSQSPPVSPTGPPSSQGGSSSLCCIPGQGCPVCDLNHSLPREGVHLCNLPFPLSESTLWGTGPNLIASLLFLIPCGSFFQPWLYRNLSASFQLVCSENYSTCRCIFDLFMGGGEFHVLLLHHLHLLSILCVYDE